MRLGELIQDIISIPPEWKTVQVGGIAYDSRTVRPGDLFVAVSGFKEDGSVYASEAVRKGAVAVVAEKPLPLSVPMIAAENSRKSLALLSNRFYGNPSRDLLVAGITGTNGKTTTAFFLESVFQQAGLEPGLLGTVLYRWKNREHPAPRTTPESLDLHRMMRGMVEEGVRSVAMEVSSHALALDRTAGMVFKAAVFTNLTQDHLDFHDTIDAYGRAKSILFGQVAPDGISVINNDDPKGELMRKASSARVKTFGLQNTSSDYRIQNLKQSEGLTRFDLKCGKKTMSVATHLWGRFNAMNAAAATICGIELGLDEKDVIRGIERVKRVQGRMDGISSPFGFRIVIDYAHTPDALENVLGTAREFTRGKILAVFGCGGDRDRGKRPLMGGIAERLADRVFVTSDNPRSEKAEAIIQDIVGGMKDASRAEILPDRERAIETALSQAKEGDTVVIAGKGHETYQEIGNQRFPFDDRLVVEALLKRMGG